MAPSSRNLSLNVLFFLFFIVVGIIPQFVIIYIFTDRFDSVVKNIDRNGFYSSGVILKNALSFHISQIEHNFEIIKDYLQKFAESNELNFIDLESRSSVKNLVAHMVDGKSVSMLSIMLPEGRGFWIGNSEVYRSMQGFMKQLINKKGRSYTIFKDTEGDTYLAITEEVKGENPFFLTVSYPFPIGSILAASFGYAGVSGFVVKGSRVIWEYNMAPAVLSFLEKEGIIDSLGSYKEVELVSYKLTKDKVLALTMPMPIDEWVLVIQRQFSASLISAQEFALYLVLSGFIILLIALFMAAIASKFLSYPIKNLAEISGEIARGKYGKQAQSKLFGKEIVELTENFNFMSKKVKESMEQLKKAVSQNHEMFISSIKAFAAAIDAKDPYTRGHSQRVATYSKTIAEEMSLPPKFREEIWLAALLHDIGKIGIDDRILKKGGSLSKEEFEIMKQHPLIGVQIVSHIPTLKDILPGIRWHHEAWDGSGYPDGLKGDAIPIMARIIAVADTFDAMTTERPYQKAFTLEEALARIKQLVGKKFDSRIVEAFLRACYEGKIKKDVDKADFTYSVIKGSSIL